MIRTVSRRVAAAFGIAVASSAAAQESIVLRLHPAVGDTLRTVMEQTVEVSDITAGSASATSKRMSTTTRVFSSSIVRAVHGNSTTVMTMIDSVLVSGGDGHADQSMAGTRRAVQAQRLVLTLGADGTIEHAVDARGAAVSPAVVEALASIPAVFPKHAVRAGEEWLREMMLPSGSRFGATGVGRARAAFRFDSLQKGTSMAFLSMRGNIVADSSKRGVMMTGSINADVQLDRTRGWICDSRFLVILESVVTPPSQAHLAPMRFLTRVSQRLRTLGR